MRIIKWLLFCSICSIKAEDTNRILIDEISAFSINESVQILCKSDNWFPSPIGMIPPLEQSLIRMAWLAYAETSGIKNRMNESMNEYAEQYLDMLQEQRGVTRDALKAMCEEIGYTILDLKYELQMQYLSQQAVEFALASRGLLHVSGQEIKEFYEANPVIVPDTYTIKRGVIKKEEIIWDEPYSLKKNELSPLFKDIDLLKNNDIIQTELTDSGNPVVYCLVDKEPEHILSLQIRYDEIMRTIQEKKYQASYKLLTYELLTSDSIEYVDQALLESIKKEFEPKE